MEFTEGRRRRQRERQKSNRFRQAKLAKQQFARAFGAVIRNLFEEKIGKSRVRKTIMFSLLNEDPHGTFFCTPQDAGVVKDARV